MCRQTRSLLSNSWSSTVHPYSKCILPANWHDAMEKRWQTRKQNMKKKKGKTNIPRGCNLGVFWGEGVKMTSWDTGTRLPILEKIKRNSKPPSLRTADAFPVVASLASAKRKRSNDRKCVCCSQATNPPPHPPPNQGWSHAKAKTGHFCILDLSGSGGGGGAGINFPSWFSPRL